MSKAPRFIALALLLIAVAVGFGQVAKPGLLLDLPAIAKGKRAAIERVFGKPTSSRKAQGKTQYFYKSKKFRTVAAMYEGKEVLLTVEYKPKDVKDWKSILAQFGLSVPTPRAVHKYFHWSDFITQFNEIPQGTVSIWREREKKSENYSGWVSVDFSSAKGPPPD